MRFACLFLCLQFIALWGVSQNKRLAIITFSPYLYYNEANEEIAKQNKLTYDQILNYFRLEIVSDLEKALKSEYQLINNNRDLTAPGSSLVEEFYSISGYYLDNADDISEKEAVKAFIKKKYLPVEQSSGIDRGELLDNIEDNTDKFLNLRITDNEKWSYLLKEIKADLFLVITQFEIRGDYSSPYTAGQPVTWNIIVHFSLIDRDQNKKISGKLINVYNNSDLTISEFCKSGIEPIALKLFKFM